MQTLQTSLKNNGATIANNFRPVQLLNSRQVYKSSGFNGATSPFPFHHAQTASLMSVLAFFLLV